MPVPTTVNTPQPRAAGYGVALGEDLFRLAVGADRALQVQTAPLEPPPMDTRSNAEEMTEEGGRTYARDDFTGGEGLDFAHTRADRVNKESRFYDSYNMDVSSPLPGQPREVRLLEQRYQELTISTVGVPVRMAYNGTSLFVAAGNFINKTATPRTGGGWSSESPHAGEAATTAQDVAALGTYFYAALGVNGIHRYTGAAWAHWSDIQATRVWNAKSRIIASSGASLYEAVAGAAPTPLYTLPNGETWNDVCDAGAAILAAASDGNIYAFTPDAVTATLTLRAQTPVEGEEPTAVGSAQGMVFYGTREASGTGYNGRWWRAELSGDLTLVNGQLLREWRSTTIDCSPKDIAATRDAVYTGIAASVTNQVSFLWRYDLTNGAVSRSYPHQANVDGSGNAQPILSIVPVGDTIYRSSAQGDGDAGEVVRIWSGHYPGQGYLIGPLGDFYTSSKKTWVGARIDADDLPAVDDGRQIDFYYSTDPEAITDPNHASWTLIASLDTASDLTDDEYPINVESRYIAGKVVLTSTSTATPVFRSFAFRAYPGTGGIDENDRLLDIPINISDQLERPNKRLAKIKGLGRRDYERVRTLEGEALDLTLYQPGEQIVYRGKIENVGAPQQAQPERGSASVYAIVRFRGREVAA